MLSGRRDVRGYSVKRRTRLPDMGSFKKIHERAVDYVLDPVLKECPRNLEPGAYEAHLSQRWEHAVVDGRVRCSDYPVEIGLPLTEAQTAWNVHQAKQAAHLKRRRHEKT